MMDDECQMKLQDTMQKIVNDNNGGMVCIIFVGQGKKEAEKAFENVTGKCAESIRKYQ